MGWHVALTGCKLETKNSRRLRVGFTSAVDSDARRRARRATGPGLELAEVRALSREPRLESFFSHVLMRAGAAQRVARRRDAPRSTDSRRHENGSRKNASKAGEAVKSDVGDLSYPLPFPSLFRAPVFPRRESPDALCEHRARAYRWPPTRNKKKPSVHYEIRPVPDTLCLDPSV